jgi:hypothetical protein
MGHGFDIYIFSLIRGLGGIEWFYPLDKILGEAGFLVFATLWGDRSYETPTQAARVPTAPPLKVGLRCASSFTVDGVTGEAQTSEMKRMTWTVLLAMAGLAILPQTALAGQFKKPVYYPLNDVPYGVVTADFNNDGNLDLAVASYSPGEVGILLGKGDGTFHSPHYFSAGGAVALAVGDFNGDHNQDLAVVEYGGTGYGGLEIFLGDGHGNFTKSAGYQVGIEPLSAAVADFDGDGHLDVAVTNEGSNGNGSVMLFFGNGSGAFRGPTTYQLPFYPDSVAAGDLNGDGRPDLAVAEYNAGVAVLLNKGGGKFGKPVLYPVSPAAVTSVVIAELNHDNHPDLVVATFKAVGVLLGRGGGKFGKTTLYPTSSITNEYNPWAVVVADFNLDGNPDIATVLEGGSSALFYGKGKGRFGSAVPIRLRKGGGRGITAGDFRKDTAPDLAIGVSAIGVAILLNVR